MSQFSLFDPAPNSGEEIALPNADITYFPQWLSGERADKLFSYFLHALDWRQSTLQLYGKAVLIPRMNAWYGDEGTPYQYSGAHFDARQFNPQLETLRDELQNCLGLRFNSVLANLYRNGDDSVSWHADDEKELGVEPAIASVSLGAVRRFSLKHQKQRQLPVKSIDLPHGSLLLMKGATQTHWHHQVPKTSKAVGPRINLTFRWVNPV